MTVKRSRIYHSSSTSGQTTAIPPSFLVRNDLDFRNSDNEQRKGGIFSISSPEPGLVVDWRGYDDVSPQLCGFLQNCGYCCKRITPDIDIYMYSYLRAFCSEECRQKQIDIDTDLEMLCMNPRAKWVSTYTKLSDTKQQGKHGGF